MSSDMKVRLWLVQIGDGPHMLYIMLNVYDAGIAVLHLDAPILAGELTRRGWPLILASALLGSGALMLLRRETPRGTRVLAVGAVVAIVWGWVSPSTRTSCPGR